MNNHISILYVEDEDNVRAMLSRFLKRFCQELFVATNGQEGLELYHQHKPDIVISDIKMPKMSGLEMAKRIKEHNRHQLILLLTAHSDGEYLYEAINMGVDGYILKPVDLDIVHEKITTLIENIENKKTAQKLKESEEQFRTITEVSMSGIFIYQETFVYVNSAFCELTGYSEEELYQMPPWELVAPEYKEAMKKIALKRLQGEHLEGIERVIKIVTKSKTIKTIKISTTTMSYKNGYAGTGHAIDISDIIKTKSRLKLLSQAVEQTEDMVLITDINANIIYVNPSMVKHSGYSEDELLGNNCRIFKSGEHPTEFYKKLWSTILNNQTFSEVFINKKKDGSLYYDEKTISPIANENGEIRYFVATSRDISKRIALEEELKRLATKDTLLGIYNRYKINTKIEEEFQRAKRYKTSFGLIMLDIDHFKAVNDTYGHDVGDSVLQELSKVVLANIRNTDAFGRWGGEEFMILVPHADKEELKNLSEKIRHSVEKHNFSTVDTITISLGASLLREDDTLQSLFKRVDEALYASKEAGRNRVTIA